jgi:hypothetical protein
MIRCAQKPFPVSIIEKYQVVATVIPGYPEKPSPGFVMKIFFDVPFQNLNDLNFTIAEQERSRSLLTPVSGICAYTDFFIRHCLSPVLR